MSYDGIVTKAVVKELNETILGGRIDKIYQPEKDEILIYIHNKGTNYKLVTSASSNNPRLYLTENLKKNPNTPPMFCMLLRKHLSGGIILNVEQQSLDRNISIEVSSLDELGQPTEKRLIIEIMGKHSNIILVEKNSYKIIDSIKKVTENMSRVRQILPGLTYALPPDNDKFDLSSSTRTEFDKIINESNPNLKVFKMFYSNYIGLSPLIGKEICFNSNIGANRTLDSLSQDELDYLFATFKSLKHLIYKENFNPLLISSQEDNKIIAFYSLDLNQFSDVNKRFMQSISQILDIYYHKEDSIDRIGQRSHSIRKSIQIKLDRAINKLLKQKEELSESNDRETFKIYGDLISANIHNIVPGLDFIELDNFYSEDMDKLHVPLDKRLSPPINAQRYYKKYSKLKTANQLLLEQIPETENEIMYLENVLMGLDNITELEELEEIREELIKEGYLKDKTKKKNKNKTETTSSPHHFISTENFHIYVGKNNKQNDYLTLKYAHREDLWFHAQNMPGSHVLVKTENRDIPESTLEEAAMLAAYFSKGKNSTGVPVDYTIKKNVRKAKNAKTGMVIYDNFKTIIINPSKEMVEKLKKVEK